MAGEESSEASNVKMAEIQRAPGVIMRLLGSRGRLEDWAPCARCAHGALAHAFDEPHQRCVNCECAGYRKKWRFLR